MKKIRILIVEDQELTRFGFRAMIEKNEEMIVVAEAENGKSAIAKAVELKPDVVVMDIGLPVMNGIDAASSIMAKCPDIRVLMLTSHKEAKLVFAALSCGAKGYCLKDVSFDRLAVSIKAVANGDVWLDPEIAGVVFNSLSGNTAISSSGHLEPKATLAKGDRASLSDREMEVLELLVQGYRNSEISDSLCITIDTVKSHMSHIMNKLSASDRTQAALEAVKRGIVSLH